MKYDHLRTMCVLTGATAAILGGAAPAALAQQRDTTIIGERAIEEVRSVSVSYRDLDLATARGERMLHYRVKGAMHQVCEPDADRNTYRPYFKCLKFAHNGVLPQIDLAVRRAREIASTGTTSIPLVAIGVVGVR